MAASGAPALRIDRRKREEVTLALLLGGGTTHAEAETALRDLLEDFAHGKFLASRRPPMWGFLSL
jgi:hypothetical protein